MNASARLHRISAELKAAGETGIRRELLRTVRAQAVPLRDAVQKAAIEQLPRGGGLNQREAAAVKVQVLTSARSAGVRLRNPQIGSSQTDRGYVRHPVFGVWRKGMPNQQLPKARLWWRLTLAKKAPEVAAALNLTIQRINLKIGRL